MTMIQLCSSQSGIPFQSVIRTVIPAGGVAVAFGSMFFALQALDLNHKDRRQDVTAQPHGISTIIFFAYVLFILGPEYNATGDYEVAWATGNGPSSSRLRHIYSH